MATFTRITEEELRDVVARNGFNQVLISKDYYVTLLLYLLKDIDGLYFKGGTALQKIFLNHSRLSEDIDFTVTRKISVVKKEIEDLINKSKLFDKITKDKHVYKFVRLIVHYIDPFKAKGMVFIDLNERAQLLRNPEKHEIRHFYEKNIPTFSLKTISMDELIAEKMAAAIGRNKPRDHFDLYQIIKHKFPINLELVKKKCELSGDEFDIIKMFNQAKKLKNRWDQDMLQLLAEEVAFPVIMKTLAQHFKLKEEKEQRKRTKKDNE